MRWPIVYTILRKELLETLRDKRTLFTMFGVPILLYPLLIIVMGQVTILQQTKVEKRISKVAVADNAAPMLRDWLEGMEKVELVSLTDPNDQLLSGQIDAAVLGPQEDRELLNETMSVDIRIIYDLAEEDSRAALERVREGLQKQREKLLKERLDRLKLPIEFVRPIRIWQINVATPKKLTGSVLGMILPMVMIIMLGTGAFYPAVDVTAGEKERGTFETLLSAPVSKAEIVCGKFVTVLTLCLITGLLSLASMVLSLLFQFSQMAKAAGENLNVDLSLVQVSPVTLVILFLTMVPLAFFICAMMMSIAIIARDFKEAQSFVTPFYILILLPGMIAAVPGVKLTAATMFLPIANVALLFKDLLTGTAGVEEVFAVLLSTAVYAMLSLVIAVRLFEVEDVILSQERGLPLTLRRSAFSPGGKVSPGMALVLFGVGLLLMFYAGTYVQLRHLLFGLLISQWFLIAVPPVAVLWYTRMDLRQELRLRWPSLRSVIAALLMAAGLWVLIMQLTWWQQRWLPESEAFIREMDKLFRWGQTPGGLILLILAVGFSPAVCEELLFRGAILSGLRNRFSPWVAILVSGVLFGFMHQNVYMLLHTTLLGFALGFLALRSRSIIPAMLFHCYINTTTVLLATGKAPQIVLAMMGQWKEANQFPVWLLILATAVCIVAFLLLRQEDKKAETTYF
ncbi:MAG: CPBP family intramembrane metalloprotease [Sedimentisphaerales bacterium]|nr:CPBP family intramembrane metalloprotease [Sedimentisphaerales bacterium]